MLVSFSNSLGTSPDSFVYPIIRKHVVCWKKLHTKNAYPNNTPPAKLAELCTCIQIAVASEESTPAHCSTTWKQDGLAKRKVRVHIRGGGGLW